VIDSDRPRRSLLISSSWSAAATARFRSTGSGRRVWTGKYLIQPRFRNLCGQRNSALRSESDTSPKVPANSDTIYPRPPSRSGSRPDTPLRQRRQTRTLLPILKNAFSQRRPDSRRYTRRHHQFTTETASQQFLFLSTATISILFQHTRRPDGSSLYTVLSVVATPPCHRSPTVSTAISAPSTPFEEGLERATHEST
jgi:hypothetical protein